MNTIVHSSHSVVHLSAALIALLAGTYILLTPKGTISHQFVGRLYSVSMGLLLFTAFQMYYLFGYFGIVHWATLGSVSALIVGLGSVGLRRFIGSWLRWHYLGMGASVTGLYASFVVESTYRFFPLIYFWWITLGSTAVIFLIGSFVLYRHYPVWARQMGHPSERVVFGETNQALRSTD